MTKEQILARLGTIHGLIEEAQEEIAELASGMPDIRPHPELYKCALYLEQFTDSLEIGQKNIDRLVGGKPVLPPKRYS